MKIKWKQPIQFALCILPIAAIGGWFTGSYAYASYPAAMQQQILEQVGSVTILCLVAALQSVMLAFVCALVGYVFSRAVGLMQPLRLEREKLYPSLWATLGCGIFFSLDYWTFGRWLPCVAATYQNEITTKRLDNWLASIFYGGMVEELMLRLFLMSILAFVIWKLFFRKYGREQIPTGVFAAANVVSALLFAAGHLPTTMAMFGTLTPLIVVRCFVLNGALGLVFGWLYRKYGIQYAMLGHAGSHVLSKIIWLLFV